MSPMIQLRLSYRAWALARTYRKLMRIERRNARKAGRRPRTLTQVLNSK